MIRMTSLLKYILFIGFLSVGVWAQSPLADDSSNCPQISQIQEILRQAVQIGVPLFNNGYAKECFFVYEGTIYKVLYVFEMCPGIKEVLNQGIFNANGKKDDKARAWALRNAMDQALRLKAETK